MVIIILFLHSNLLFNSLIIIGMNKKSIERRIKMALKPLHCRCTLLFQGDYVRVYPVSDLFTATELNFLCGVKPLRFVCVSFDSSNIYALFKILDV